jgi:hypothetical protein
VICNFVGVGQANNGTLVRMLINSFVWSAVAAIVVTTQFATQRIKELGQIVR